MMSFSGTVSGLSKFKASAALLVIGCLVSPSAFATAFSGCEAVNIGLLNVSGTTPRQVHVKDLDPGDVITFRIDHMVTSGSATWSLTDQASNPVRSQSFLFTATDTYTVTVSTQTTLVQDTVPPVNGLDLLAVTATCVPAGTLPPKPDVSNLQQGITPSIAMRSGTIIQDATRQGIGAAFDGAPAFQGGSGGFTANFAADPGARSAAKRARDGFRALGLADDGLDPIAPEMQRWNAWANLRASWLTDGGTSDAEGNHLNGTVGLGYKITPDVVVGALAGYEGFDYEFKALGSGLDGTGVTVGAYAGIRFMQALRLTGLVGWSGLDYGVTNGAVTGSFDASRWIVSGELSGSHQYGAYMFTPSANLFVAWEDQDAYVDSGATPHAAFSFYSGRAAFGGRVGRDWVMSETLRITPYVGAFADWNFSDTSATAATAVDTGLGDGWSARALLGVAMVQASGLSLNLSGELGGIGQDATVITANGRVMMPF